MPATGAPWASRTNPALPAYARIPALVSPARGTFLISEHGRQSRQSLGRGGNKSCDLHSRFTRPNFFMQYALTVTMQNA